jgi:hypothetical protein
MTERVQAWVLCLYPRLPGSEQPGYQGEEDPDLDQTVLLVSYWDKSATFHTTQYEGSTSFNYIVALPGLDPRLPGS